VAVEAAGLQKLVDALDGALGVGRHLGREVLGIGMIPSHQVLVNCDESHETLREAFLLLKMKNPPAAGR